MVPDILDRRTVWSGYLRVERLRLRLPTGAEVVREIEDHGEAVAVLPYDPVRRTALVVRLFRAPAFVLHGEAELEEACAGMIDGDSPEAAVRREAHEELGLLVSGLEFIGRVWASPGVSAERVSLFLAPYAREDLAGTGGGAPDEHEGITVIERSLADLARGADEGAIADLKLLALVQSLRARRPDLFQP